MTRIRIVLAVLATSALATAAFAQGGTSTQKANRSEEILKRVRQLDLLNHLLPLTLTKAQINDLLIPIEKSRQKVKQIEGLEADDLAKYESRVNAAVTGGADDGKVPSPDLLKEINRLFLAFSVRRQIAAGENADLVLAVMRRSFNKGQITVAANSIDPKAYDPTVDPKTLAEDDKLKLFIKDVLLDPQAYEILTRMAKRAP